MKKILKTSLFAFLAIALGSCENTKDEVAIAAGGPKLLSPAIGSSFVLLPINATNVATTLVWDYSDNGVPAAASYKIEIAKAGTNFANILNGGTTTNRFVSWTVEQLNGVLIADPTILPFASQSLNVRIKSTLGSAANAIVQYSNVLTISVTPYSTALPKLGVPGAHQMPSPWTPTSPTLPVLASSGFGLKNFEGYINLNGDFKFLSQRPNGTFDWGAGFEWADDGSFSGTLVATGGSNCTAAAGYYRVRANTNLTGPGALSYAITPVSTWGIIGDATATGWGASTPMTFNPTTKLWTITLPLTGGNKVKFRYNNDWNAGGVEQNLGKFDAAKTGNDFGGEFMSYGGGDIPIASSGTYIVTLDLTSPRNYKYTIVAQ